MKRKTYALLLAFLLTLGNAFAPAAEEPDFSGSTSSPSEEDETTAEDEAAETAAIQDPREVGEAMLARESRNGFDTGVNLLVIDGISISIPAYFALGIETSLENTANYYAEKDAGRAAVWISVEASDYAAGTAPDTIAEDILSHYQGAELLASDPIGLAGYEGRALTFVYTTLNGAYLYRYAFALDASNGRLIRLYLGETQTVSYNYVPDFDRIVGSAYVSGTSSLAAAAADPQLVSVLNGLEAYFDQYIALLQTISTASEGSDYTEAYNQYLTLLEQYETQMSQLQTIDMSSLSEADQAYYWQVYQRIMQKIGTVGG